MRIAYITHYAELYGANRSMLDLLLELRRRGEVEPFVLLPRAGALTEKLAAEGVLFAVIPWQPWMSERHYMGRLHHRIGQYLRYERAARQRAAHNKHLLPDVLKQLRTWEVEAVHLNSSAVGIAGLLINKAHVPIFWHIRELPEHQYLLHIDVGRRQYGSTLRKADRLIAISEAVRKDIHRYADRNTMVDLIYNGVLARHDYQALAERSDDRWQQASPFTFLIAGLIHPSKGQEEAIRAFALVHRELPNTQLLIAGDGKADHLHALIAELGLKDHVHMLGFVKNMTPLFERSHVLLMCSRNEAMGRVTVEAMGSGLPVIGHLSGGTVELIKDGVTGLFYPGGAKELAERMITLARDPAKARVLGENAMKDAAERFNVERYATEVSEVYRSVLSQASLV